MKIVGGVFLFVTLLMAACCYLTTHNIIFTFALIIIYLLYYFLVLRKSFKKYYSLTNRIHTCYHFINSFIITLSVKDSYEDAYESGLRISDKTLKTQTKELTKLNIYDRVKYLRRYFKLSIYKMFLNVLDLYQDQGGNILSMSDNLIRECTRTEKALSEAKAIGNKHLVDFSVLWLMATGILLFLRFGISEMYSKMIENKIFSVLIFIYFLLFLLSIHLFFRAYTDLTIKEDYNA